MIRVGIAASTPALRAGLRAMLTSSDIEIVVESASLLTLDATGTRIDGIIVADEALLDDLTEIDLDSRTLAIVLLSDHMRAIETLQPLPLRGWALIPPDVATEALTAALNAAVQGLIVVAPTLAGSLMTYQSSAPSLAADNQEEPLTVREQEVLNLLSQGLPNKLIARQLQISEHTVKFHVSSIYAKLGVSSRTEAVSRGARRGLVSF